jgi:putative ABC transport system permease protein
VLQGKREGALADPYTAVMTESAARKYFGTEDPIGKVFSRNKKDDYKVTAVVADQPPNTHLKFDILLSFRHTSSVQALKRKQHLTGMAFIPTCCWHRVPTAEDGSKNCTGRREKGGSRIQGTERSCRLQTAAAKRHSPYFQLHGRSRSEWRWQSRYFLFIISIFIIVIAWINYVNLSTARSLDRAKEVGVRKVMGSHRIQLIRQFLFESFLINLLAVVLAFLLVILVLPLFNSITGKNVSFSLLTDAASGWR